MEYFKLSLREKDIYFMIDIKKYLIENHLICIEYKKKIPKKKLRELYEKIIESLKSEKTSEFVSLYFGNNAINATELKTLFPIYL